MWPEPLHNQVGSGGFVASGLTYSGDESVLDKGGVVRPCKPVPMDIDNLWEYDDPAKSEAIFRAAITGADGDDYLELLTQVARARGLQGDFEDAHRLLDQVEADLPQSRICARGPLSARTWPRLQLKRGR